MKTAITSTGNNLDSMLDQRFGRCSYFAIYDPDNDGLEFIPNPYKDAPGGAGPAAVQIIVSRNVSKIISGEFGMKIKSLLDSMNIQLIILAGTEKSIREIIEMLKKNHH